MVNFVTTSVLRLTNAVLTQNDTSFFPRQPLVLITTWKLPVTLTPTAKLAPLATDSNKASCWWGMQVMAEV